ncbi:MAG TPA: SGNH/GDSL hydrolase family protein [Candidatus Tectomicrobia bacterium]|nr:SGNH/GDSL hydrolase family protein [Candidatus Tectomicrobia bacterium]
MVLSLSERQKELVTGFLIIGIMAGGWGVGEALLRLVRRGQFGKAANIERSAQFHRDQHTGLRLPVPNSTQGKIRINSLGFRSPEIPVPKPPGTVRLAFLGSSTTYDLYADNASTWPQLVTQALQATYPACHVDHVNAGVPGFSSPHMLTYYRAYVSKLEPDIVVLLPTDTSVALRNLARRKHVHTGLPMQPSWFAQYSELWAKIEKNVRMLKLQRAAFFPHGKLTFTSEELAAELRPALEAIAAQVTRDQRLLAVVTVGEQLHPEQDRKEQQRAASTALYAMPFMSIPGLLRARQYHNEVIADIARASNAILIEGHEQIPGTSVYYADTSHFKPAGSRLMAERVSAVLIHAPAVRRLFETRQELCRGS